MAGEDVRPSDVDLGNADYYINRELSYLAFSKRVLEEANDTYHPILERVKFLAICGSNLDEFFMSRISEQLRQMARGTIKTNPDGMTPSRTIDEIRRMLMPLLDEHSVCWHDRLRQQLGRSGIDIHAWSELDDRQRHTLRQLFQFEIFPTLTPLALDARLPFPFISNLSLNLIVTIRSPAGKDGFARIKIPSTTFPRFLCIPDEADETASATGRQRFHFILLEDLIMANLDLLFPGMEIINSFLFRVTRDAEIQYRLDEVDDMVTGVKEGLESRRLGPPVRLEVDSKIPAPILELLVRNLALPDRLVFQQTPPFGVVDFWQLLGIDRPDLKDIPFIQHTPSDLNDPKDIFTALGARDHLLFHPYDSFAPVVNMLQQAAADPDVLAIKVTLYRIDKRSPVVDALIAARKNGKQVASVVELKAKFDEQNNISYAKSMEQEGVHVVYGPADLKVHAKMCLVVRKERRGIIRYCHLSSGNYNNITTKVYGDLAYITTDPEIGRDVSNLFNALTGYAHIPFYNKLLVAPAGLRSGIVDRVHREIDRHHEFRNGRIAWKLNGLLDKEVVKSLYQASQEGVKVDLNVRGLCSLRPGMKGVSENITVTSVVGRFLEHSRIYHFHNGGQDEVLLGSSDMMPRNLDKRVELLFPVQDIGIRNALIEKILATHLADNVKARRLCPDGTYARVKPAKGDAELDSQIWFIENRGIWHEV